MISRVAPRELDEKNRSVIIQWMDEEGKTGRVSKYSLTNITRLIRNIPNLGILYMRLLLDPRISLGTKIIPLFGLLYVISPYDLLPGFLVPVLGWLEDIIILFFCMRTFGKLVPPEIIEEHIRTIEGRR